MKSLVMTVASLVVAGFVFTGCNCSSKSNEGAKCPVGKKEATVCATCPVPTGDKGAASPGGVCPVQGQGKDAAAGSGMPAGHGGASAGQGTIEGSVLQTLSAGRYLYVEVDTKAGPVWVAGVAGQPVAKGDKISCPQGMKMEKFSSPSLKRTFDQVYFIESMTVTKSESAPAAAK